MVRPYDAETDEAALWQAKRAFELGLGSGTGGDDKRAKYEGKLTDAYRESWLAWVDRCVAADERCVLVEPVADAGSDDGEDGANALAGYVFVLPERLAHVWDAAVLNELWVAPDDRGTGVADDLVDEAVAFARSQDLPLDRLVLDVDRENERAKAFYERHGFAHWGEMVAREL
ncbi:GNAT family N-acetyltransferase [Haloarchaeobius iranensis]|uniref:Acetyltransferase (GNAT) family protein n=1 Tax=Haloarchaeobius iranensis TaxID=996166 RepID=A0A1G9Z0C5_9EURY|nr:N-acetyltransferase [Haloarchaeobius iranensis]SDN14647.1 Acetyltransferase (GNAT) family protein [Haloarchaeobius iranensis]